MDSSRFLFLKIKHIFHQICKFLSQIINFKNKFSNVSPRNLEVGGVCVESPNTYQM